MEWPAPCGQTYGYFVRPSAILAANHCLPASSATSGHSARISAGRNGQSGTGYHGYWAEDLYEVDEHYGTADDLLSLLSLERAKGRAALKRIIPMTPMTLIPPGHQHSSCCRPPPDHHGEEGDGSVAAT